MADYRGPFDNAEAIANFLVKDAEVFDAVVIVKLDGYTNGFLRF